MSYLRPMGDGPVTSPSRVDGGDVPITSPSQVDDSILVGDVGAKRVSCSELPPDSPWRLPGRVCDTQFNLVDMVSGLLSRIGGALSSSQPSTTPSGPGPQTVVLLGAAAVAGYYMFRKPKRT